MWDLSIPFITRQVLRGYVGTHKCCIKQTTEKQNPSQKPIGIIALLSIGLPYDLWHYDNNTKKGSNDQRFNPFHCSLKSIQERTMIRIKEMQRVDNWDILAMYYDEHLGFVITHIINGKTFLKTVEMKYSCMKKLLNAFYDIQTRNEKTLDDASTIDTTDNNAKKQWWKSRHCLDNDMKNLISELNEIISSSNIFSAASLECDLSNMSLSQTKNMEEKRNNPTILVLGSEIQCFPWESTNILQKIHITRMPSIHSLLDLWERISRKGAKQHQNIYALSKSSFIINPEKNLPQTEQNFCKLIEGKSDDNSISSNAKLSTMLSKINTGKTKKIFMGEKPKSKDILNLLQSSDILTYWGHDSLMKFTSSGKIAKSSKNTHCIIFDMR